MRKVYSRQGLRQADQTYRRPDLLRWSRHHRTRRGKASSVEEKNSDHFPRSSCFPKSGDDDWKGNWSSSQDSQFRVWATKERLRRVWGMDSTEGIECNEGGRAYPGRTAVRQVSWR